MANFIPEKDKKAKTPLEQPNTKASALSDDELDGVSGGAETLRAEAKTDEEQDDEDNKSYGNPPTPGYTQLK